MEAVDALWAKYRAGEVSLDEKREAVSSFAGGAPWYEREGVNRSKLDDILRQAAAGQAGVIRKALGGSISHEPGRFPGYTQGGHVKGYADGGSADNSLAACRSGVTDHSVCTSID